MRSSSWTRGRLKAVQRSLVWSLGDLDRLIRLQQYLLLRLAR